LADWTSADNKTNWKQIMTMKIIHGRWMLVAMLTLFGCNGSKQEETSMVMPISISKWQALEKKRVVFGHQSVGYNILNGVTRLAGRDGVKILMHEQRTGVALLGISHFTIGKNGDPLSKIHDFAAAIDAGAAQGADIAMMKLCYVDFNATSDAKQVAKDYITSLESLAQKHPGTTFVAVTVPLMAVQTGPKAWIKQLMGRQPNGYLDNVKRAEFNTQLREHYLAAGRLFDIARIEADECCKVNVEGQQIEALNPELTTDGGHLNERGQEVVAAALLDFVSTLPAKQAAR
jgi:hypothetical protein